MNKLTKAWRTLRDEGFDSFRSKWKAFNWSGQAKRILVYPYAYWRFPREAQKNPSVRDAVALILGGFWGVFAAQQVRSEITSLCEIVKEREPARVLEIGTAKGGTLLLFACFAAPNATITSIDLPKGSPSAFSAERTAALYKRFGYPEQHVTLVRRNSHQQETFQSFKEMLKGAMLDFLFIDGDHTYEGAKADYELYAPLVKKGGIIALHDICKHPSGSDVDRLWDEIKQGRDYREFIEVPAQGWGGIGVLFI